jgi:hypothetical protein
MACRYHLITMDDTRITNIRLDPRRTTLSEQGGAEVVLAVGVGDLVDAVFRHDPPTPSEMERAIDLVEDALMASRLPQGDRGELLTSDPLLRGLPGLREDGARLQRAAVESLFQALASASLGHLGTRGDIPAGAETAAALLVLRECMHHLGYEAVRVHRT